MLDLKRGDTLSYSGFLPEGWLPAGDWSVSAAAYDKRDRQGFPIDAELIAPSGDETRYMLRLYAGASRTRVWPARKLDCDVQFKDSSATPEPFVFSSATFVLNVLADATT